VTGNGLLGMSHGWWVDKHNRHHGNPNHQDLDPDIDVGVIAYSEEQALAKTGLSRWIVSHQAGLFFPLLFGLAWTMHVSSVRFLVNTKERLRWVEVGALCLQPLAFHAPCRNGWAVARVAGDRHPEMRRRLLPGPGLRPQPHGHAS